MEQINPEQIQERIKELPGIIQEAIDNSSWEEKIRRIASTHGLRVDQGAALEKLTQLTMLGFKNPQDFLREVKDNVWVSDEEARNITIDVGEKIFDPIKSEIVKISRKEAGLPERTEIDEVIYGKEEDSLNIYNVNASLESVPEEEEVEPVKIKEDEEKDELISRDQVAKEMKKDIEIVEEDEEDEEVDVIDTINHFNEKGDMSKKLEEPTSATIENTTLDPYRESLI